MLWVKAQVSTRRDHPGRAWICIPRRFWEQVRQTRSTVSRSDPALGNWGELHDLSRSLPDYFSQLWDQSYSRKGNLALWVISYSVNSKFDICHCILSEALEHRGWCHEVGASLEYRNASLQVQQRSLTEDVTASPKVRSSPQRGWIIPTSANNRLMGDLL